MKKIFFIFAVTLLFFPFFSEANGSYEEVDSYQIEVYAEAGGLVRTINVEYEGMVPCGRCLPSDNYYNAYLDTVHSCESGTAFIPCTLCHTFIIFDRIISFVLGMLIPALALLAIVGAGVILIVSTDNPNLVTKAKNTLLWAVGGLFLAYFSWLAVSIIISQFMDSDWDISWTGIEVQHMCSLEIEESDLEAPE